jgi:DNA-binding NarL/FixJ family response regulator
LLEEEKALAGSSVGGKVGSIALVMALRVVFAEDNYLVREGTSALLRETGEIDLVATAADGDELLEAVEEHEPNAVLTDIRMPPSHTTEGIEVAKRIRAEHPEIGVVVLSQYVEEEYAFDLLKDGASGLGYLLKERVSDLDEVVRALNEVAAGGSVLDPKVVEGLVARKNRLAHSPLGHLTDRERQVLEQMAQGKNNANIAQSLFLTERAVEKHINSLFHKLELSEEPQVHRRVMAVLTWLREATGGASNTGSVR